MSLEPVICNQCGQVIPVYAGDGTQDYLHIEKTWGFFSDKDGQLHRMNLCEVCYDKWIAGFAIPIEMTEATEFL